MINIKNIQLNKIVVIITLLFLLACKDKNNDLYQLNVIDYVTNIAKSCFFPYYYVNKCFNS